MPQVNTAGAPAWVVAIAASVVLLVPVCCWAALQIYAVWQRIQDDHAHMRATLHALVSTAMATNARLERNAAKIDQMSLRLNGDTESSCRHDLPGPGSASTQSPNPLDPPATQERSPDTDTPTSTTG